MSATVHDGLRRVLTRLSQDMLLGRWQTRRRLSGGKVIQLLEGKRGTRTVAPHGHPERCSPRPATVAYIQRRKCGDGRKCGVEMWGQTDWHHCFDDVHPYRSKGRPPI